MSLFSEILSQYIKEKNLKIYQIANLSGVDRSLIQKMISGTRKPSNKEQVLNLSRALSLTHSETEKLTNAFDILEIGEENWRRYQSVQSLIQSFRVDESSSSISVNCSDFSLPEICGTKVFHTATTINRILYSIFLEESINPNGWIKMTLQPTYSFPISCLTTINAELVPIEHFICLENVPEQEIINLENIQKIIPVLLSCRRYTPYGYYDHIQSIFSSSVFLPNTILTSKYLVRISNDYTEAVVTDQPDLMALFSKYFEMQKVSSWPIFEQLKSFEEYLQFTLSEGNILSAYYIMNHPGVLPLLPLDTLKRIVKPSSLSPDIIEMMQEKLSTPAEERFPIYSFFSWEGLKAFCSDGTFSEIPLQFYSPLNETETHALLEHILSLAEAGCYHPRILRSNLFEIPNNVALCTISRQKSVIIFNHPQKGFLAFDVKNITLSSAIYDFMEYLQQEGTMTFSEAESLKKIEEFLEEQHPAQ